MLVSFSSQGVDLQKQRSLKQKWSSCKQPITFYLKEKNLVVMGSSFSRSPIFLDSIGKILNLKLIPL